jgi:hypothetical protein
LQLMAKDRDLQILGVLVAPYEPSEHSPEDQGHERPHHEVLPLLILGPTSRRVTLSGAGKSVGGGIGGHI